MGPKGVGYSFVSEPTRMPDKMEQTSSIGTPSPAWETRGHDDDETARKSRGAKAEAAVLLVVPNLAERAIASS